jgi:hypothetical protein
MSECTSAADQLINTWLHLHQQSSKPAKQLQYIRTVRACLDVLLQAHVPCALELSMGVHDNLHIVPTLLMPPPASLCHSMCSCACLQIRIRASASLVVLGFKLQPAIDISLSNPTDFIVNWLKESVLGPPTGEALWACKLHAPAPRCMCCCICAVFDRLQHSACGHAGWMQYSGSEPASQPRKWHTCGCHNTLAPYPGLYCCCSVMHQEHIWKGSWSPTVCMPARQGQEWPAVL